MPSPSDNELIASILADIRASSDALKQDKDVLRKDMV